MEDVVLHYQPRSAGGLNSLLERTEKLLKPFPCRTPPVFTPWYPSVATDRRLPIRPARPAPIIISTSDDPPVSVNKECSTTIVPASSPSQLKKTENTYKFAGKGHHKDLDSDNPGCPFMKTQRREAPSRVVHSPNHREPETRVVRLSPKKTTHRNKERDGVTAKRSWSLFTRSSRGVALHAFTSHSQQFRNVVSVHRLNLRQRAKWIIGERNCGAGRDIEQVRIKTSKKHSDLASVGNTATT